MNRMLYGGAVAFFSFIALSGCSKPAGEKVGSVDLVTTTDTVSYLIGIDIARSLREVKDDIVLDIVFAGVRDRLAGSERRFPPEAERVIMEAFSMQMQQKQMAKSETEAAKNLKEAKDFLEENGKKPGVVTTESGLQYIVLKEGDGPIPPDSSKVKVHYEGTLLNGKVFDSSIRRGEPSIFTTHQVIAGWTEALKLMKVGSKFKLFVPPDLAYGRRGMAHDIRPNMLLIFEIELLGIEK
ncbi:MAG: FKBP-type peptidyl-prolyl cis-trans isomerase [Chitinispirillaceae bacterium]|nr:FKBP-type peptidyl-prolyl cis-trans isomerase [Chitinispirillaceae bacterium]